MVIIYLLIELMRMSPIPTMRIQVSLAMKPTTSLTLLRIHETIEPIIPGKAAPAFSANLASKFFKASNLFLIQLGVGFGVGFGTEVTLFGISNSIRKPIVIPIAVNIVAIVIPCSRKSILIFSPRLLFSNFLKVSFI